MIDQKPAYTENSKEKESEKNDQPKNGKVESKDPIIKSKKVLPLVSVVLLKS